MEQKLRNFLEEVRVNSRTKEGEKGEPFTHTSKNGGKWVAGSYFIDRKYYPKFMKLYMKCVNSKIYPTLAEKPGPVTPVHHDFDLAIPYKKGMKVPKRLYSKEQLCKLINIYQDEIRTIVREDSFEDKLLWAFVTEKPSARVEGDKIRDGFHLHFPFFLTISDIQDHHLRDKVIRRSREEGIWDDISYIEFPVPDEHMAKKVWMMYGSMNYKDEKSVPYLYVRRTKYPKGDDPKKKESGKKLIKQGYAFNHLLQEIKLAEFFEKEMISREGKVSQYLPDLLSIQGYETPTPLIDSINVKYRPKLRKKTDSYAQKRPIEMVLEDIKTIKDGEIMSMLSYERAEDYHSWLEVGIALFNISQGCDEGLELWIEFSRQAPNFAEGYCEEVWETLTYQGKSINWLLGMARKDSPERYKYWKQTNIDYNIDRSLYKQNPTAYDVSVVVKKLYGDKFLCAWAKKNEWYYFEDHRWRYMDDGVTLKRLFTTEITDEYYRYKAKLASDQKGADSDQRDKIQSKIKRCDKIIEKLGCPNFWDTLIKACVLNMHDPNFNSKLNMNSKIYVCENGVLDLENLVFREGRQDDYSTFCCGINYPKTPPTQEQIDDINFFFMKIFPNEKRREYAWDYLASLMEGVNRNKIILVCTGDGDNGKSVFFAFLEKVFGGGEDGYWGKFPSALIETGNNVSSAQARPEMIRGIGRKCMSFDEISKFKTLDVGKLKEISGDTDSHWYRTLHDSRGRQCRQTYSVMMQLNDPPKIPSGDQATWNRIRVLDFESKFVRPTELRKNPVPKTFEEQMKAKKFVADIYLSEKMDEMAETMLWMLFERYKRYKVHGIKEPLEVQYATESYQKDNDIFRQFIGDRLQRVEDETEAREKYVTRVKMFEEFKVWIKNNYESYGKTSQLEMTRELNRRMGIRKEETDVYGYDDTRKRWYGWQFRPEDEGGGFQSGSLTKAASPPRILGNHN